MIIPSANIRSRWLNISQALFCKANTQLSSPKKLGWFAHLSSQSEHRICFVLSTRRFNHKNCNKYALLTRCEVKMAGYLLTLPSSCSIKMQKRMRPIFSHLERTNLGRVVQGLVKITQG